MYFGLYHLIFFYQLIYILLALPSHGQGFLSNLNDGIKSRGRESEQTDRITLDNQLRNHPISEDRQKANKFNKRREQTIQYRNRRRLESSSTSQQHAEGSSRRVTFRGVHYSSDISPHSSQQHMQHPYQRINQRHGQQVLNVLLTLLVHQMGNFLLHFQT